MKPIQLTSGLMVLAAALATAQSNDFEGVVLYEHGDYGGSTLTLYPGEGIPSLGDYWESDWETWNDQISSLAVWGNVVVYLYTDVNYRGEVLEVRDHVERLSDYNWNDRTSSVWVDYAEPDGWYWDATFENWIYVDTGNWLYHFEGLGWIYGGDYDTLNGRGWIWDTKRGWLFISPDTNGWLADGSGAWYYYLPGSHDPRWWYTDYTGWFSD